jgi:hypothetical protein
VTRSPAPSIESRRSSTVPFFLGGSTSTSSARSRGTRFSARWSPAGSKSAAVESRRRLQPQPMSRPVVSGEGRQLSDPAPDEPALTRDTPERRSRPTRANSGALPSGGGTRLWSPRDRPRDRQSEPAKASFSSRNASRRSSRSPATWNLSLVSAALTRLSQTWDDQVRRLLWARLSDRRLLRSGLDAIESLYPARTRLMT